MIIGNVDGWGKVKIDTTVCVHLFLNYKGNNDQLH